MSPEVQLFVELMARGIGITASGAWLDLYPRSALNPDLLERVRALKPQLLELIYSSAHAVASPAELQVLEALALRPGLTREELGEVACLSSCCLARALRNLVRRGEIAIDEMGQVVLHTV